MRGDLDISQATGQATVASAATSITMFGLSMSEVAVLVSAAVAVLTFALHVWYTLKKDKREQIEHARRMQETNTEPAVEKEEP